MKVYYIFKIKKPFISLYKDTPSILYNILRSIYFMDKDSLEYGYNIINQLIENIDKDRLDREIYLEMHQDIPYFKRKDTHIISNLYKDELSKLIINNLYMKLELSQDYSSFYKYLLKKENNLFVCDFKKTDFFFLDNTC